MQLKDFVGNKKVVLTLTSWLNDCYSGTTSYTIVFGDSGNGKSVILKLLADYFDAELFLITPYNIQSEKDIYNIIKSINMQPMFNSRKLIGIDDIDEFSISNQKALMQVKSSYPIIYTSKTYGLDRDFINKSFKIVKSINGKVVKEELIKVRKPLSSEVLEHLKTISSLPIETLEKIAKESRSFRSAVLAVKSCDVNELVTPYETNAEFLRRIKERKLERPLDRNDITFIFNSIRGYGKNELLLMSKFAEFDYRTKVRYETIEPYEINNMLEPIQDVNLSYIFKNNKENKKVEKKELTVAEKKSNSTIDKWI